MFLSALNRKLFLSLLLSASPAGALAEQVEPDQPAFQWLEKGDRLYRLDTASGNVAVCSRLNGNLVCRDGANERSAWRAEMNALQERLDLLERQVVELELRVDEQLIDQLSTGSAEPDAALEPEDDGETEALAPAPEPEKPDRGENVVEAEPENPLPSPPAEEDATQTAPVENPDETKSASRVKKVLDGSRELLRLLVARAREMGDNLIQ